MKRAILSLSTLVIVGMVVLDANASIELKIADSSAIHTALGKSPDSLWFRKAAYEAIRDGDVGLVDPDSTYWIDSLYVSQRPNAFANLLDTNVAGPDDNYMVVGVADDFIVPTTGQYTFEVRALDALFIVIDGELLTDTEGMVFLYEGLDDPVDSSKGENGYPAAKLTGAMANLGFGDGYVCEKTLEAGSHTFEFYFADIEKLSVAEVYWTLPGADKKARIPASAFSTRKNYGPLRMQIVQNDHFGKECPYEILKGQCPNPVHVDVALLSGARPEDTVYFCWDLFADGHRAEQEGIVDIKTTETYMETLIVCETADQKVNFHVWAEVGGRKSPVAEGGSCNVFYCALDHCPPAWQALYPDVYEECQTLPDGACSEGDNIDPDTVVAIRHRSPLPPPSSSALLSRDGPVSVYTVAGRKLSEREVAMMKSGTGLRSHGGVYILRYGNALRGERVVKIVR